MSFRVFMCLLFSLVTSHQFVPMYEPTLSLYLEVRTNQVALKVFQCWRHLVLLCPSLSFSDTSCFSHFSLEPTDEGVSNEVSHGEPIGVNVTYGVTSKTRVKCKQKQTSPDHRHCQKQIAEAKNLLKTSEVTEGFRS